MDYSQKISERLWNLPDKGELESKREQTFIDDIVQKAHIERALLENINGVKTVFDAGAGCGRFSILLAKRGLHVTHYDISGPMLEKAKALAEAAGVSAGITFVRGALEDLSAYADRSFDMAISFDSPVSYTYPNQESVIGSLVRIAKKKIMLSVTSRLGSLPYMSNPIQKSQFILDESSDDPFVRWCVEQRKVQINGFTFNKSACDEMYDKGLPGEGREEIAAYKRGEAPWVLTYAFLPDELTRILSGCGVKNIRLAGPGAYARTLPVEILRKIVSDEKQKRDFLDFCYRFDSEPSVCGMGKDNLLAYGTL